MTLHNAPPSHGQVIATAVILASVLLFAVTFIAVLFATVRRDRLAQREDA